MGNHLKGCGCRHCRSGMHTKSGSRYMLKVVRSTRRAAKLALRRGEVPAPTRAAGHTD